MKNDEYFDLFEDYYFERMRGGERDQFERRLASEPDLSEAFAVFKKLLAGLRGIGREQFQQRLSEAKDELEAGGFFLKDEEIDAYLMGKADEEIHQKIRRRIMEDPAFRERIEADKQIMGGLQDQGRRHFANALQAAHSKLKEEGFFEEPAGDSAKTRRLPIRSVLAIAASAAVLLIAAWWLWLRPLTDHQIFNRYYTLDLDLVESFAASKGFAGEQDEELLSVVAALREKEYASARAQIAEIRQKSAPDAQRYYVAQLLEAQLDLKDGLLDKALPPLKELAAKDEFSYKTAAQWFLGLAYVRQKDHRQAIPVFRLLEENPRFGEQAQNILKDLQ